MLGIYRGGGRRVVRILWTWIVLGLFLLPPVEVQSEEKGRIAVLPFRIHALQPLDHLKQGLQEMFLKRLSDKGLSLVPQAEVNSHPLAFLPELDREDIAALGRDLRASWLVTGSLTQIGKKVSLDVKALDTAGGAPPFSVFMVEENLDKLADASDRATVSLYNQISGVEQIDSLRVKNNRRIESEAVLAVVESAKGGPLDYDQLDKDLRAIYGMGFFTDVKVELEDGPKGKIVTFNVTEKPSVGRIAFVGNDKVKEKDLQQESGIKIYSILNRSEIRQSIGRLREFYRQKGYYNVKINESISDLPQNEVALTYQIDEGEKVYIRKIAFEGNTKFDDDDLKDLMETSEKGFLSWFTKSGLLDDKLLEYDQYKITSFYHNHGYIKAKTGEPKITYVEGEGLTLTIEVIEGPQYGVRNVAVEGDLIRPAEELLKEIGIGAEEYYNREVVRKDAKTLREIYADEGFAHAEVSPLTNQDDENYKVDITYNISKGKKVRFERINITGNTRTRDKVIRRELKIIEGEYFSGKGLKKSIANLHRLGYFENVEVQTKKGDSDDLMVMDINVKEKPTGSFAMGVGYSSYENVMGTAQISENNLFGKGQKLAAAVRLGSKTNYYDIRFLEPWLFERQLEFGVDLYKWESEYDEYTKDSLGGALSLGFPIGIDEEYTRASVKYTYDDADVSDVADSASQLIKDMIGTTLTSSITLGLKRDSTDRPWNTTSGSINSITFEYAGGFLAGDAYFNKYEFKSAWFFPVILDTVFHVQGRWGYVEERSGGRLPLYKKFRIGGINTVRGYDDWSISPKDPLTGDRIGGEKMMIYNLEYRFPLVKKQGVVGVVFLDAGNVYEKDDSYSFSGIKKSTGAGIRWYSPVGPIRLEYGKIISPEDDEPSGNWEFNVGGFF
ncbi:MAG: outer membrane protein assembly factor BamA [Deltaproteobacteria bacterium]|nr:outer membrane protein assembly factor BamA [Deltaproteobacteria bacterium]